MKVLVLISVFIGIAALEYPKLIKRKQWVAMAVSLVLLITGFVLSLLQVIGVKIPDPNEGIAILIKLLPRL